MAKEKNKLVTPPNSLESEQACLGAILIDPGYAFAEIQEFLTPEDFYRSHHQIIYKNMLELYAEHKPIDTLTLSQKLKEKNLLEAAGGSLYISELTTIVPTSGNVRYYAQIVKEKSQLRQLMEISSQIYEMATSEAEEVQDIVDRAEGMIFKIAENRSKGRVVSVKEVLKKTVDIIGDRMSNKGVYTGIVSGFKDLDNMTYGFQNSDLIILAARPSMGKTAFALNIMSHAAIKSNKSVLFFSLEMSAESLIQRLLASEGRVDSSAIRSGYIQPSDWRKIIEASGRLSAAKIWIEDSPGLSHIDIRAIARRLKAKNQLDLIIIDYLQLISLPHGRKEENRQVTVSEISRNLKMIARELNVPVIALSQLSRAVESRSEKEPMLSDLRESGALEQDADLVLFIHRPGYYKKDDEQIKNLAEIIIAKQRNGPTGKIKLTFLDRYTQFEDYYDASRI